MNRKPTIADLVRRVFSDAGVGTKLTIGDVTTRVAALVAEFNRLADPTDSEFALIDVDKVIKGVPLALAPATLRGEIVRVARGIYTLPSVETSRSSADTTGSIDDDTAEDIRAEERRRIASELAFAVRDAVPQETKDYLRGFQDGANYVSERALGALVTEDATPD